MTEVAKLLWQHLHATDQKTAGSDIYNLTKLQVLIHNCPNWKDDEDLVDLDNRVKTDFAVARRNLYDSLWSDYELEKEIQDDD